MKLKSRLWVAIIVLTLSGFSAVYGHADYVGYSGSPVSAGKCALTCHGDSGGTIAISGFPTEYTPGQSYLIWVTHTGGAAIVNFNCSIRDGANSMPTGDLTAGLNTDVYVSGATEPKGVHFLSASHDSGSFTWTADTVGVATVKLFLAGLQSDYSGPNTVVTASASQHIGINDQTQVPPGPAFTLANRIVRDYLVMRVNIPAGAGGPIRILTGMGRQVAAISVVPSAGVQSFIWAPVDDMGRRLAPGSYFASLAAGGRRLIRKFVVAD